MAINVIHTKPEFIDERGGIARILDQDRFPIRAVLRITSKKGSSRANHYHQTDCHYIYIESGKCEYSEKDSKDPDGKVESIVMEAGDMVLSEPGMIHGVKFLEDTIFYAFTSERRGQAEYEKNLKRVEIVK
ncbi:MAG: cupin domain-containing protein [Candidatus Levybacteria bacterium]|nr:cupin domain-containing protein [Candidatus Levybacteria bacterium]